MNQNLKKFGKKAFIFTLLLIVIDWMAGKLITPVYLSQKSGSAYKTVYAFESSREPLIILGSSRAYHHYNSNILSRKLKVAGYNLGRDGAGVLYDYAAYHTVCTRSIPQYLIIDINMEEFMSPSVTYDLLHQLLPHYHKNKYVKEVVNLRSPYEFIKAQSALYRYNSELFYMLVYNYKAGDTQQGFLPLYGKLNTTEDLYAAPELKLDSVLVHYFEKLLTDAQRNKTKVFVFISPTFNKYRNESMTTIATEKLCKKHGVPFFNFTEDSTYRKHPEYFNDYSHLNIQGANIYSNTVADSILHSL